MIQSNISPTGSLFYLLITGDVHLNDTIFDYNAEINLKLDSSSILIFNSSFLNANSQYVNAINSNVTVLDSNFENSKEIE